MTTANKITIVRILLVPLFIVQMLYYVETGKDWHRILALLSFAVAAGSDAVDGFIARRYNQRSELGSILDPLADKMLLVSGVILLSLDNEPHLRRVPIFFTATVLSRDVLLIVGLTVIYYICGRVQVRPILVGKAATVLQMATVLWAMLKLKTDYLVWWAALAALTTGISGVIYILDGVRQLSASPSSAASPRQQ